MEIESSSSSSSPPLPNNDDPIDTLLNKCNEKITKVIVGMEKLQNYLESDIKILGEKSDELKSLSLSAHSNCKDIPPRKKIKLNVGGKIFMTTVTTLSKEHSMLSAMISKINQEDQEGGEYFIDRDPKHFSVILEFLRKGGKVITEGWTRRDMLEIRREAAYYQLSGLLTLMDSTHLLNNNNNNNNNDYSYGIDIVKGSSSTIQSHYPFKQIICEEDLNSAKTNLQSIKIEKSTTVDENNETLAQLLSKALARPACIMLLPDGDESSSGGWSSDEW